MLRLTIFILAIAALPIPARGEPCVRPSTEYCLAGCEDLGRWVVEPFDSFEEAALMLVSLDPVERISAFIAQTPLGNVLVRRERVSAPAPRPDPHVPHWRLQEYAHLLDATADAYAEGGWIYSTNGSHASAVRVWYQECPSERSRPVKR